MAYAFRCRLPWARRLRCARWATFATEETARTAGCRLRCGRPTFTPEEILMTRGGLRGGCGRGGTWRPQQGRRSTGEGRRGWGGRGRLSRRGCTSGTAARRITLRRFAGRPAGRPAACVGDPSLRIEDAAFELIEHVAARTLAVRLGRVAWGGFARPWRGCGHVALRCGPSTSPRVALPALHEAHEEPGDED